MPRGQNKNNYHFKVFYRNGLTEEDTERSKYYRTCKEIEQEFGLTRHQIYNIYTGITKLNDKSLVLKIEKLAEPKPVFKKVLVTFD